MVEEECCVCVRSLLFLFSSPAVKLPSLLAHTAMREEEQRTLQATLGQLLRFLALRVPDFFSPEFQHTDEAYHALVAQLDPAINQ